MFSSNANSFYEVISCKKIKLYINANLEKHEEFARKLSQINKSSKTWTNIVENKKLALETASHWSSIFNALCK